MSTRQTLYGKDARAKIQKGVNHLADAVKVTLGAQGRHVIIASNIMAPHPTKDGVTVARSIISNDPVENIGVDMVREVAAKTVDEAGDGPQPLYAKVLTPKGWICMGDLKIGDEICGTDKSIQHVVGVFPKGEKEIYKIEFSDGRIVECCEEHLWAVKTKNGLEKTLTTKQLKENLFDTQKDGSTAYMYYTPSTKVEFYSNKEKMPLDPYLVGVLIGDGSLSGETIEISLGAKKEHVINKLVLPDGIYISKRYDEKKNYFRLKLNGITPEGKNMPTLLSQIGLHGTRSSTKFIPKEYLFSSTENRLALLQGLMDTDGYINSRGLFEFSTVSHTLAKDFTELFRGLGRQTTIHLHTREKDTESYSDRPIFRMCERAGYKYGLKIVNIEPTGHYTEMMCIKVSNNDSLYITDDYVVTHNTTTSCVLAQALINGCISAIDAGHNPIDIKKQLEDGVIKVVKRLSELSRRVETDEELINIATISANNDPIIGGLIAEVIRKVGKDGNVTVENSTTGKTEILVVEGMRVESGFIEPYFVTNIDKMKAEHKDVQILLCEDELTHLVDLLPFLDKWNAAGAKPLLIIAKDVNGEALGTLVHSKIKNGLGICAIRVPGMGTNKGQILDDIAAVTGGTVISENRGLHIKDATVDHVGKAAKFVCDKKQTVIVDGRGDQQKIADRVTALKSQADEAKGNEKELLVQRIASISNGVAVVFVAGMTDSEIKEKKDRIDDAICATKAALEEGYVAGGGTAYLDCANILGQSEGDKILREALYSPYKQGLHNAGMSNQDGFSYGEGINVLTGKKCNLFQVGIIDPVKVSRVALEKAASVAGLILTTECVSYEEVEVKK